MPRAAKKEVTAEALSLETTEAENAEVEKTSENVSVETEKTESKPKEIKTDSDGLVCVVSKKRAGKSIIGTTGDIVTFDKDGVAKCKKEDADHFLKIPDFELK